MVVMMLMVVMMVIMTMMLMTVMMLMVLMMMVECATVSKIHPAHHRRVAHSGKEKHVFREGPSK